MNETRLLPFSENELMCEKMFVMFHAENFSGQVDQVRLIANLNIIKIDNWSNVHLKHNYPGLSLQTSRLNSHKRGQINFKSLYVYAYNIYNISLMLEKTLFK